MLNRIKEAYNKLEEAIKNTNTSGGKSIINDEHINIRDIKYAVYTEEVYSALRACLESEKALSQNKITKYRAKLGRCLVEQLVQNLPKENPNYYRTIGELEFSARIKNCLVEKLGLDINSFTVGDFVKQFRVEDLLSFRGFGETSLREVKRKLADLGLCLRNYGDRGDSGLYIQKQQGSNF